MSAVHAANAAAPAAPKTTFKQTTAMDGLGKDAFLQLLVAQMRYQDPSSPLDGQQYMAQLAQFAQVERLDELAKSQAEVSGYQRVLLSAAFVGKTIKGVPIGGDTAITGVAEALRFKAGVPLLIVNGKEIPVDGVEEVTVRS